MITSEPEDRKLIAAPEHGEPKSPRAYEHELNALLEEQQRLRQEFERLLDENRRLREHPNGRPQDQSGNEEKGGTGAQTEEKKPDEKQDQKKQDDQQDKDKDDKGKKEKPKEPRIRRIRNWARTHPLAVILILAALILLLVGGYLFWEYLQSYVSTDDAQIDGHIHQIGSRISGAVVGVYTENNRSVQQGQTLVDLDPRDYEATLQQAKANLAQVEANLQAQSPNVPITQTSQATAVSTSRLEVANAEAALEAARQTYESSAADVRQAAANLANAQREEERYRLLAEKEEVSRELYDQRATTARAQAELLSSRQSAADAASRTVLQRQAALNEARERATETEVNRPRELAVQHATVASRRANVQAARAQVEAAALNLSYCKIFAPVTGIIGNKTVEKGQQVAPGEELLAITGTADMWVTANFKETQIRQMHPGQSATIHVDAIDRDFNGYVENMPGGTGAVYSLLPPENATGNYIKVVQRLPVRLRFKPGQTGSERLRPGMSVEPQVWIK